MAEVVITGGQGFLGSNLVKHVSQEEEVCATYNYTLPDSPIRTPHLSYFRCDVTNMQDCAKLIMQENPKVLYHLVAQPIVTAAARNPLLTMELSTRGTWNILEAVRLYGKNIEAIVFVSTDKVYGNNVYATETDVLAGVDHPYNAAKIAADVIAQSYALAYKLPIVISRSANLYGPGDFHWDRIVPGTCRDIVNGYRTVIRSSGQQKRDYIYILDGIRALMSMATYMANGQLPYGSIFNFGSERMYSAMDIIHKLLEIGKRIDLVPDILDRAKDEINEQHIVYDKASKVLGWKPMVDIEAGLDLTFNWYKTWLEKKA